MVWVCYINCNISPRLFSQLKKKFPSRRFEVWTLGCQINNRKLLKLQPSKVVSYPCSSELATLEQIQTWDQTISSTYYHHPDTNVLLIFASSFIINRLLALQIGGEFSIPSSSMSILEHDGWNWVGRQIGLSVKSSRNRTQRRKFNPVEILFEIQNRHAKHGWRTRSYPKDVDQLNDFLLDLAKKVDSPLTAPISDFIPSFDLDLELQELDRELERYHQN